VFPSPLSYLGKSVPGHGLILLSSLISTGNDFCRIIVRSDQSLQPLRYELADGNSSSPETFPYCPDRHRTPAPSSEVKSAWNYTTLFTVNVQETFQTNVTDRKEVRPTYVQCPSLRKSTSADTSSGSLKSNVKATAPNRVKGPPNNKIHYHLQTSGRMGRHDIPTVRS
jgi:hypothetical protein